MKHFPLIQKIVHPIWLLAVYPTWFIFPGLLPGTNKILKGQEATDLNGTVFQAQILKNMVYPWSSNQMFNAPVGESFWNIFAVPQSIHWGALWSLTRFLSPVQAVNFWLLIGWLLSGLAAYLLARYMRVSILGSVFAGLLVEILPWVREKASAHMAYVFLCVPLFAVLLALRHFDNPSKRSLVSIIGYLGLVFFFDLYWFYFVLLTFFLVAVFNLQGIHSRFKRQSKRFKLTVYGVVTSASFFAMALILLFQNLTTSDRAFGRPLEPTTNSYIDLFNGSVTRFIVPWSDHFLVRSGFFTSEKLNSDAVIYGGLLIIGISVIGVMYRVGDRKAFNKDQATILLVAVSFLSLTIPSRVSVLNLEISTPVSLLKYLMPGVRHFGRAGMVTQALLCVFCAVVIDQLWTFSGSILIKKTFICVVMALCIIDLSPLSLREVRSAYLEYEGVRTVLSKEDSPVLYAFSPILDAGNYLNVRSVRRSYDHGWNRDFEVQAALGDENFAAYLASRGVTHVLIPDQTNNPGSYFTKWGNGSSIDLSFPATLYDQIPTSYNGIPVVLYKLRTGLTDEFCKHCVRYQLDWSGVRQAFFDPVTASISPDQQVSENLSWVLPSENPSLTISTHSDSSSIFQVSLDLVAAFGPNAQPQIVQLVSNIETRTFRVEAGLVTKASIRVKANESILLRHFLPCTVPSNLEPGNPDTRQLCFGVTGATVIQSGTSN